MNLTLFHSILDAELMPLKLKDDNKQKIRKSLIKAGCKKPRTLGELLIWLGILAFPFPELYKRMFKICRKNKQPLKPLPYEMDLPPFLDGDAEYFQEFIAGENLRIYNQFILKAGKFKKYGYRLAERILEKLERLARRVSNEIRNTHFDKYQPGTPLLYFVLTHLKFQLIVLYFSIQELYIEQIKNPITLEQFYLLVLGETIYDIQPLRRVAETNSPAVNNEEPGDEEGKPVIVNLKYAGNIEKFKVVVRRLCKELELAENADDVCYVFLSKGFVAGSKTINLGCNTNLFRYLIIRLKPWFDDLSLVNLVKCRVFITLNGNPLSLYALTSAGRKKLKRPKKADLVDSIIQGLHQ